MGGYIREITLAGTFDGAYGAVIWFYGAISLSHYRSLYLTSSMAVIKFHKVPELFPNRKVRTVRTEQLWVATITG